MRSSSSATSAAWRASRGAWASSTSAASSAASSAARAPVPSIRDGHVPDGAQAGGEAVVGREQPGAGEVAAGGRGDGVGPGGVEAVGHQVGGDGARGHGVELHRHAPAGDGGQLGAHLGGEEHEHGGGGGLLDRLEQETHRHVLDGLEADAHHHLAVALHGGAHRVAHDGLGLLTAHRGPLGLDHPQVRVGLGERQPCVALGLLRGRALGQEPGGEGPGRGPLARALGSHQQVGVDRAAGGGTELGDGVVLAHDLGPDVDPSGGRCLGGARHPRIIARRPAPASGR
jgi:hypothetical protein